MSVLERIKGHDDLLLLSNTERTQLCQEIRDFLVAHVSKTGGHLAGNLGIVELSVALETVYNTMKDRLLFDVGHQAYVHKILTGRQADFDTLRQYGGLSGFPKPEESDSDAFVAGHASSSVSIALGMARARTLLGQSYHVVAVIGDGAATGGMAYEGLNNVAVSREPIVIILNDNEMSIGHNVGGISRHLSKIRSSRKYLKAKQSYRRALKRIPGGTSVYLFTSKIKNRLKSLVLPATMFENMGLTTLGPVDGSDLPGLCYLLQTAKEMNEPVLIHVVTKKGCGYAPAEADPSKFHGIGKFDPMTGNLLAAPKPTFSDVFGNTMTTLAGQEPKLCAITAAMPSGTGLQGFAKVYPNRFFDVGIAEEHAVSMAGGLAKQGMTPVVAIYSTFLQRSFDQILQDAALLQLHVVFAIDRAGLVGDDGPTHHGTFDVGYLRQVPGMKILAPASFAELQDMLRWAVLEGSGPIAVRYPRGSEGAYTQSTWNDAPVFSPVRHRIGKNLTLITYGTLVNTVLDAAQALSEQGIEATVLRLPELNHFTGEELHNLISSEPNVIVVEETCSHSGLKESVCWELNRISQNIQVYGMDLGDDFVPQGSMDKLYHHCGLDAASIIAFTEGVLRNENKEKA